MAGFRGLPKSRSFDPSMFRQNSMPSWTDSDGMDTAFKLASLTLDTSSPRNTFHGQETMIVSPTCSLSQTDRSIEPMNISEVSDREEVDDARDPNFNRLLEIDNTDNQSVMSDGTHSLWSVKSSLDDRLSTASLSTKRKPMEDEALSDHSSDTSSIRSLKSVRHLPETKPSPPITKKTHCKQVMDILVFVVIIAAVVMMLQRDPGGAFCEGDRLFDLDRLQVDLHKNVFGQHIAVQLILERLRKLMADKERNVTVLSFHGWTGIGKNYVGSFIAAQLHEKHVHKVIIPHDFAHEKDSEIHHEQMVARLTGFMVSCHVNLLIIDEVDKATSGTISGLQEGLRRLTTMTLKGTKVIVLLLSNSGGSAINRYLLDQMSLGRTRESLTHDEVLSFMLKVNAAQIECEWYVPLYDEDMIDAIVPFLPLEKSHVSQCAEHYITTTRPMLGTSDIREIIERVLEQMSFFPQGVELFSSTGCRGVTFKVDLTVD